MIVETIAIGTELTTGAKLDTNSQWLSQRLAEIGVVVQYHTTVADDLGANLGCLQTAVGRVDVVVITGGLGPTLDDLTRDALAGLAGVPLVLHEESLAIIRDMFARRKRVMPERNVVQAMFPSGSTVIPNPRGTAPGIYMSVPRPIGGLCHLFALPGVPSEMKGMFDESVLPKLLAWGGGSQCIQSARIHCFGLGESAFEELLGDVTARGRDPEVGITVHEATITLRVVAHGASPAECQSKIAATRAVIYERLKDRAFGEDEDELQHVVARELARQKLVVAVAEGFTGGWVVSRLSEVPEAKATCAGGVVVSHASGTERLLGVATLRPVDHHGIVARSEALAHAALNRFGTAYGIGVAEAVDGEPDATGKSLPVTAVAVAGPHGVRSAEVVLGGDPAIAVSRTGKAALDTLRHMLREDASR